MGSMLVEPVGYLAVLAWLLLVTAMGLTGRRTPLWAIPLACVVAAAVNTAVNGIPAALLSLAGMLVVVGLAFLSGALSRTGLLVLPVALLGLPVPAWIALLPGLLIAAAVSAVRLRRAAGKGYLNMVVLETAAAVGADPAAVGPLGVSKPDLSRIPLAPEATSGWGKDVAGVKVRLSWWLAVGLAGTAGVSALLG